MKLPMIAAVVAALCLPLLFAQKHEAEPINNPVFTGPVYPVKENSTPTPAHYYFPPGSRTKWHVHEFGQVILCEEGTCINAIKGGPVVALKAGEASYAPPGVEHWQGAAPDAGGTQFNNHRGKITWLETVTEAEYHMAPSHLAIVGPKK